MNNLQEQNELKANETNNLPQQNTETAALAYATAGLSVLPLKADSKNPALLEWASKQENISEQDEIRGWYKGTNHEIGIVCGKVSGQLEGLDFDEKYNIDALSLFDRFKQLVDETDPRLINKLVIEKTQNKILFTKKTHNNIMFIQNTILEALWLLKITLVVTQG